MSLNLKSEKRQYMKRNINNKVHGLTATLPDLVVAKLRPRLAENPRPALALGTEEFVGNALKEMAHHIQAASGAIPGLVAAAGDVVRGLFADNKMLLRRICVKTTISPETAAEFGNFLAALAVIHACAGNGPLDKALEDAVSRVSAVAEPNFAARLKAFRQTLYIESQEAEALADAVSGGVGKMETAGLSWPATGACILIKGTLFNKGVRISSGIPAGAANKVFTISCHMHNQRLL